MQILNDKSITFKTKQNNFFTYQKFLKNLNYKKQTNLNNDQIILKLNNLYLLYKNEQENFFFPSLNNNNNDLFKKKYINYNIEQKFNEHFIINYKKQNYNILRLYTYLLLKKFNKQYIYNLNINKQKINLYLKSNKPINLNIKGLILKRSKNHLLVNVFGLNLKMNKKQLINSRKLFYSKYKYTKIFYLYKSRLLFFKLYKFQIQKTKQKINFSRKNYVKELKKKKINKINFTSNIYLKRFQNFKNSCHNSINFHS